MSLSTAFKVPQHLLTDRYWGSTLHLFMNHKKLQQYFTPEFFDLEEGLIQTDALKRISKPWSFSEKFMLQLALHLFSEKNTVNLSDMDYLDSKNKLMALQAIRKRFSV